MICKVCGREINDGTTFCGYCGSNVGNNFNNNIGNNTGNSYNTYNSNQGGYYTNNANQNIGNNANQYNEYNMNQNIGNNANQYNEYNMNQNIGNNVNQYNGYNMNQNTVTNFDEELTKAYIGDKADKMYKELQKNLGFNIFAILCGVSYYAYRKMYLFATIITIILHIIVYFFPIVGRSSAFVIGALFYLFYKYDIDRKLKKIKNDNPNATESELLNIAREKGGTSIVGAIVFTVIYLVIVFLTV